MFLCVCVSMCVCVSVCVCVSEWLTEVAEDEKVCGSLLAALSLLITR